MSATNPHPPEHWTTRDLTRAMSHLDERAWSEFHRRYFSRLFAYSIVVLNGREASAADCVQQTSLRVLRHIRTFEDEEAFWGWLTCLNRCAAIDLIRARKRYLSVLEKVAHWKEARQPESVPSGEVEELKEHLETCLARWPGPDRLLIQRKYLEASSHAELATEFATTEKAIESKLARLRAKLRTCLAREIDYARTTR